ncbi:hypothetical protein BD311DRAFT_286103 [Dichomitus squalens]|uniref:Uncharacterized protein n=1 Tax=Dichomitus squalens TaxID=114155 RepID=A0A4Q9N2Z1_9APHY|nr:hypothetical protein BD311DRAFT_286103 [Dichomitus squalens]
MPSGSLADEPEDAEVVGAAALVVVGAALEVVGCGCGCADVVGSAALVDSGVEDEGGALSTFWGGMMELETAWVAVVEWITLDEEEEGATDVVVGAAALLERTLQRLELARFFFWGTTTGSGAALGMAARWASSRWWALRRRWGLAIAERAREQTTMALEKYIVVRMDGG